MYMRRTLVLAAGTLFGIGLLAWVLTRADLAQSWEQLRNLEPALLVYPTLLAVVNYATRAVRWVYVFPERNRPTYRDAYSALTIGHLLNNFLPGRAGDLSRCLLIRRGRAKEGGFSMALATLAVLRIYDVLTLLFVISLSFTLFAPPDWLQHLGVGAAGLAVGAAVFVVVLHAKSEWTIRKVCALLTALRLTRLCERVAHMLERFAAGLDIVSSKRRLAGVAVVTLAIWMLEGTIIVLLANSVGIDIDLAQGVTVISIVGIGTIVPSGPGFVGTYEFLIVSGLGLFGISSGSALGAAVVFHAWFFLMTTLNGTIGLLMRGFGWADLKRLRGEEQAAERELD